jgi:hypothetical protein
MKKLNLVQKVFMRKVEGKILRKEIYEIFNSSFTHEGCQIEFILSDKNKKIYALVPSVPYFDFNDHKQFNPGDTMTTYCFNNFAKRVSKVFAKLGIVSIERSPANFEGKYYPIEVMFGHGQ